MKSTLVASDPADSEAGALIQARASLLEALAQLDSIHAETAIRARLQGIIDDLDDLNVGESPSI